MDSNKPIKQSLLDIYHTAENFLADMPIAKAIGGVISNPTPQEVGAQIVGLGKSTSKSLQEFSTELKKNPAMAGSMVPYVGGIISPKFIKSLKLRGVTGDKLEDIKDLAQEIEAVGAKINDDATVDLYHRTTPDAAKKISESGKMYGKEDNLFFGTSPSGEISGYGKAVIKTSLPIEKLDIDDIFDSEAHLTYVKPRTGFLQGKFNIITAEEFLDK